jgi:hypothetical protein
MILVLLIDISDLDIKPPRLIFDSARRPVSRLIRVREWRGKILSRDNYQKMNRAGVVDVARQVIRWIAIVPNLLVGGFGLALTIADRFHGEPINVFQVLGVIASLLAVVVILGIPRPSSGSGSQW